ncbi:MAG: metal-dependent hydrolase [Methanospirillum sp.]|nr:metal-dependent hydrolase [Methanospirillum sp.]
MFILFHLLTGLVLGYLLADLLGTRRVILPCMFGALLPDLVDKPLGILVLGETLSSGRVFFHTLPLLIVVLLAGAVVLARYGRPSLFAVGVGMASHQALDVMWTQPNTWLYPFLGPFDTIATEGWFLRVFIAELTNPLEWVSGAALLALLLPVLLPGRTEALAARYGRLFRRLALGTAVLLALVGLFLIAGGALRHYSGLAGWADEALWYALVGGSVLLLTAYVLCRIAARLRVDAPWIGLI